MSEYILQLFMNVPIIQFFFKLPSPELQLNMQGPDQEVGEAEGVILTVSVAAVHEMIEGMLYLCLYEQTSALSSL